MRFLLGGAREETHGKPNHHLRRLVSDVWAKGIDTSSFVWINLNITDGACNYCVRTENHVCMHLKVKRICYWMIKWVIRQWLAVPYICYCRQIVWLAWWGQGNILILIRHPHRQDASQQNLRLIRTWGIGNNLRLGWRKCALLSGRYAHPIVQPSMLCPSDWARDWRSRGWVTVTFSQHTLRRERFLRPTVLCRRSLTRGTGHELWPTSQRPYDMMNSVSSIEEVLHDTRQIILFNTNCLYFTYILFFQLLGWLPGLTKLPLFFSLPRD
jgi:hypothetical protein